MSPTCSPPFAYEWGARLNSMHNPSISSPPTATQPSLKQALAQLHAFFLTHNQKSEANFFLQQEKKSIQKHEQGAWHMQNAAHMQGKAQEQATILQQQQEQSATIEAPQLAARLLCMHVLKLTKAQTITETARLLSPQQWAHIQDMALRHAKGEPLAYIFGKKEFYGRDFLVTADTLIPRPESEDVLDAVFTFLKEKTLSTAPLTFADIGTGSGCLACTLAAHMPTARGIMLDISPKALAVAVHNAKQHQVLDRIQPLQGTLYQMPIAQHSLDVLLSNPPYVSQEEYQGLATNVRHYEPKTALVPVLPVGSTSTFDPQGLCHIQALAHQAHAVLKVGGICVVEHGYKQGEAVRRIFAQHGPWQILHTGQDLAGLDRYCLCKK